MRTETITVKVRDLKPYLKNPRVNDAAVPKVMKSLQDFGYVNRIVVDRDNCIVAGHTRLKAMLALGWDDHEIEVTRYDAPEDKVRAYRIADNSTADVADWDYDLLEDEVSELEDYDFEDYGLFTTDDGSIDFDRLEDRLGEKDEAQQAFEDKFKPKHTTDDCFTPSKVYDAVKAWVFETYGIPDGTEVVRPFYPGGDYQNYDYPEGCMVLDNPPFSIQSEIVKWYQDKGIPFFLFSQTLTCFQQLNQCNIVITGNNIVYENGATIPTAFETNLGTDRVLVSSELYSIIDEAQPSEAAELGSYAWPENVISGAQLAKFPKYGISMSFRHVQPIKKVGETKQDIFGGGGLVSDMMAEKVKAEKVKAEKVKAKVPIILTDDERAVIAQLNAADGAI